MSASVVRLQHVSTKWPRNQSEKLPPRRIPNSEVRAREYLTSDEVSALMKAARTTGRHGHRKAPQPRQ